MSYLGLRIDDGDTHRMARGEDNVGRCVDEDPPSTSAKEVPSHVDANGVMMWLRPVGESRADAFWKKFSFPPKARVSFPSLGPQFLNWMEEDWGGMNFIY